MDIEVVKKAVAAIRRGEMVVITDDESRENEGDLVMAAECVTPAAVNFMVTHGRGLICVPMTSERARTLGLAAMAPPRDSFRTAFTVSVDARDGITTGISAYDRAATIERLADPSTRPEALTVPGHVFPLIARAGGVLERPGHTEAAIDLARLAGRAPVGVICEIMNDDGTMARVPDLTEYVARHGLVWCTIRDLIRYRQEHVPTQLDAEPTPRERIG
jgi:3,4-dihydroxy 2-butanone 4-phosphate synthase/GTP cyclohydrolase II